MADKQYDDSNTGVLFNNDRKEKPTHPDLRGEGNFVTPEGVSIPVWISAWAKTSKAGKQFVSLSFTPKDNSKAAVKGGNIIANITQPVEKQSGVVPGLDDEMPF